MSQQNCIIFLFDENENIRESSKMDLLEYSFAKYPLNNKKLFINISNLNIGVLLLDIFTISLVSRTR
jgi:hypothetical protein